MLGVILYLYRKMHLWEERLIQMAASTTGSEGISGEAADFPPISPRIKVIPLAMANKPTQAGHPFFNKNHAVNDAPALPPV